MALAEHVIRRSAPGVHPEASFLVKLDQALAEENAPIRSTGPGVLALTALIVKELLSRPAHSQERPRIERTRRWD
jgi:hypothetical protein